MRYEEYKGEERDIMDDSMEKEVINKIKQIIGKDFDVNIKNQHELVDFIKNPENYIEDKDIARDIIELNSLINMMEDFYNV